MEIKAAIGNKNRKSAVGKTDISKDIVSKTETNATIGQRNSNLRNEISEVSGNLYFTKISL